MNTIIEEGNKLIAEFIGYQKESPGELLNATKNDKYHTPHDVYPFPDCKMQFHEKWDWLMPVWNNIMAWGKNEYGIYWEQVITESMINIKAGRQNIIFITPVMSYEQVAITDVWLAVVEFIKWYNKEHEKHTN